MYSNYNMYRTSPNMRGFNRNNYNNQGDRLFGGGFVAPLLLGGIAGYALGRPNYGWGGYNNYYYYPYPYYYPSYYSTNYYY